MSKNQCKYILQSQRRCKRKVGNGFFCWQHIGKADTDKIINIVSPRKMTLWFLFFMLRDLERFFKIIDPENPPEKLRNIFLEHVNVQFEKHFWTGKDNAAVLLLWDKAKAMYRIYHYLMDGQPNCPTRKNIFSEDLKILSDEEYQDVREYVWTLITDP